MHNLERNISRSKLDSVGHKVSIHHSMSFKSLQRLSTRVILATICATGSIVGK
jgi:hypothetical protein